ncbi:MAG: sigma-70 family RNA polymerase sigma factor [Planctomycetes bacterium]|nr:sigma-70 family RNA polymerase sigma factor [Planctomycetota bacterium]MCB9886920.1 sigma-70 family RNA polymerase sigma factor [Planctomycetota bacterium]
MSEFSADDLTQHATAMRRLAWDLLHDAGLAEDAVQQAFVTALQRPPAVRTGLAGWLRCVVRNCATDLLRAEGRRKRRESRLTPPQESPTPAATAQRLEGQAAIGLAVRDLGEPYATAVWLRYYEGLSPTEIAQRLGVPVKTVKTRLGRALQQLRNRLQHDHGTQHGWIMSLLPLAELPLAGTTSTAAAAAGAGLMQSKVFGGVAVLVVMIAAAALWSRTRDPAGAVRPQSAAPVATAEVDAGAAPQHIGGDEPAAPEQRVAADLVPPAPPGPSLRVRVLGTDGQPLPFAPVWHSLPDDEVQKGALSDAELRHLSWDREAWLQHFGAVATTDADGIARWPWQELPRRSWTCVARHGADYGEIYISGMAQPDAVHLLQLEVDHNCVVQVLDAHRLPAHDVPIATHYVASNGGKRTDHVAGLTDEHGFATLRHVQLWSRRIEPHGDSLPATVGVALPGIEVGRAIDARHLPQDPIVLTLPNAGCIEVTLRDAMGEPIADQGFELEADESVGLQRTDARGVATFARVGLGLQWRLGREHTPRERYRSVRGPATDGEVVTVRWQPEPAPTLVGRLLRDGAPVAGETLLATSDHRGITRESIATDREGRFRIAVTGGEPGQHLTALTLRPHDDEHGVTGERADWHGDFVVTQGAHDLGVLALQTEPLVLRVQFAAATGVLPRDLGFAVQAAVGPLEDPWRALHLPKHIDGDGRFSVFGDAPRAPLRLVVHTDQQFLPVPPLLFACGDRDLHVELRRGGSVRASIVAGSHVEAFCLQPLLVPLDRRDEPTENGRFDAGLDARVPREQGFVADDPLEMAYTWPAVVPGRYRLEVRSRGLPAPLLVLSDIVVVDGERCDEARLQHLRIPGLQAIELTLPQANNASPSSGRLGLGLVAVLDGDRVAEPCWQIDSPLVLFASTTPIDVLVRLNGHRDRIVRGAFGKQTIELQPGLPVTVRCPDPTPTAGRTVRLELHAVHDALAARRPAVYSAAAGGALPPYEGPTLAADLVEGRVQFLLPFAGRYRIEASLSNGGAAATDLAVTPPEIDIGDEGGTFDLHLNRPR